VCECVLVLSALASAWSLFPFSQALSGVLGCQHYRLSAVRASGISGISWAAPAIGSTSDGGVCYVQLPL